MGVARGVCGRGEGSVWAWRGECVGGINIEMSDLPIVVRNHKH